MKKIWISILAILLMTACSEAADNKLAMEKIAIKRADGQVVNFNVARAVTDETRANGLMFMEVLGAGEGMIFLYEKPQEVYFWMKNTLIPLDMVFFNDKGEITHIVASAQPQTLDPRGPNRSDTCAVLEINGGAAAATGLKPGDKLVFTDDSACLP